MASRPSIATPPAPTACRRWAASRPWASRWRGGGAARACRCGSPAAAGRLRSRPRADSTAATRGRRCGCWPACWRRAPFAGAAGRRRLAVAPADAPRHRAADGDGRATSSAAEGGRPPLGVRGGAAGRHHTTPRKCRAPRSRAPSCWPVFAPRGRPRSSSRSRRATTPSGRWRRSAVVRRSGRCRTASPCAAAARLAGGLALRVPGDPSACAFLGVAASRPARVGRRRSPASASTRPARRCSTCCGAPAPTCDVTPTEDVARRAGRDVRIAHGTLGDVVIAPAEVPAAHRRTAGAGGAGDLRRQPARSAAPPSCASRRATASRRSCRGSGPWAPTPTSSPTASPSGQSPAAHRRRRSTRTTTTGWRWRSRSPRSARPAPPPSTAPRSRRCPIPRFFDDSGRAARVKADKVYLVGFMGAGKSTVARALAKRLDWRAEDIDERDRARSSSATLPSIFRQSGEPYFRAAGAPGAGRPAAGARRGGGHRRRHAVDPRNRDADAARRRGGVARRAVRPHRRPRPARRAPAAGRRPRRAGAAL